MHYFFAKHLENNYFTIEEADLRQIKNVLKLKDQTKIMCIYDHKHYLTKIEGSTIIKLRLICEQVQNNESPVKITLIVGLIRSGRWDYLLQKATELGATSIVPFQFERSVVQLYGENNTNKISRWIKICKEASEQSRRNIIPNVLNIEQDLVKIKEHLGAINLLCYENEQNQKTLQETLKNKGDSITIVIGPEGGFTDKELQTLNGYGYQNVSLGSRILRTETVPLMVLSVIMYERELK